MTRGIIFIAILLHLAILTTASTPSPSPSPSPSPPQATTQESSKRPQVQIVSSGLRGTPQASPAPTRAVGRYLGTSGFESPAFVRRCTKCCRQTRNRYRGIFSYLKACNACRLKRNLNAPRSGRCRQGAPLGFANAPSECFFDRCYRMLAAMGPCICVE